jgi:phosphohistidine phosphatase SixA
VFINRRTLTLGLLSSAALPKPHAQTPVTGNEAAAALRQGGVVLLIRHAQTDAGVGDPPGFRLNVCKTQRNLNAQGLAQAKQIAAWFARHQLSPRAVKSSQWCRTRDTARLVFGQYSDWAALNNFFETREREPGQTAQLRAALQNLPPDSFEVWVAHGVNMVALTGQSPAPAEGFVVDRSGTIIARTPFD